MPKKRHLSAYANKVVSLRFEYEQNEKIKKQKNKLFF
jgi:hypothetical protein